MLPLSVVFAQEFNKFDAITCAKFSFKYNEFVNFGATRKR